MKRWRPTALPLGRQLRRMPLKLRVLFRGGFALLAVAAVGLAISVLIDEKERSRRLYAEALKKSASQIVARLRHPTGQLALLNPRALDAGASPVHPWVLPFAALDFDDRNKARQAVELAGCGLQYPDGANLCVAIGANPFAGGFVYVVASFASPALAAHERGDLELAGVHRALVDVAYRGVANRWTAPYEQSRDGRGRLTGYAGEAPLARGVRPVKDFRGWMWQEGRCIDPQEDPLRCKRRTFLSIRLPVAVLQDAIAARDADWPPPDIDRMAIRLRLLGPEGTGTVFDSDAPGATAPFALSELRDMLHAGERLVVRRVGAGTPLVSIDGAGTGDDRASPWLERLVQALPIQGGALPLREQSLVDTSFGRFEVALEGDLRSVNRTIAAVATRLAWTVGAMLVAVLAVWISLELFVIRRITLLTARAAAVSGAMRAPGPDGPVPELDLSDLRGSDELGVLARGLKDLLQRVREDARRERIRAAQEKDLWHAVGHEIMAPLQSLMALHSKSGDPSTRYISRMQQAVRVLYGQASPSEAFEASRMSLQPVDLDAFLGQVAANAGCIGIEGIEFSPRGQPLPVRADEHALEDVVTHVLRNAQRHRAPGSPIRIGIDADAQSVRATLHNVGAPIAPERMERIFEYGVSGADATADSANSAKGTPSSERRGQGLFVARTYMAKMGGTISARNCEDGVEFTLTFPRLPAF